MDVIKTIDTGIHDAIKEICGNSVTIREKHPVHGGDANDAYALILSDSGKLFMKSNTLANADFFRAESEGLAALKATAAIRVPETYAMGSDAGYSFLLMEYIERGRTSADYWEELGIKLAAMHKADTSSFVSGGSYGFMNDNYIGAGKQFNRQYNSWIEFFATQRLMPQFKLAESYFDTGLIKTASNLADHLDRFLFEPDHPSLLHGDLWSGNIMSDENGRPMLIDPAAYVGCNEADIAMTELFGGFDRRFYISYFDTFGSTPGYEDRRDLYNLYHLTNHLNLFGRSYLPSVAGIIIRYGA